jgi:hypothetical protein
VSQLHNELAERRANHENLDTIRRWYLATLRASDIAWVDLSPEEHRFLTDALNSYTAWLLAHEQN